MFSMFLLAIPSWSFGLPSVVVYYPRSKYFVVFFVLILVLASLPHVCCGKSAWSSLLEFEPSDARMCRENPASFPRAETRQVWNSFSLPDGKFKTVSLLRGGVWQWTFFLVFSDPAFGWRFSETFPVGVSKDAIFLWLMPFSSQIQSSKVLSNYWFFGVSCVVPVFKHCFWL